MTVMRVQPDDGPPETLLSGGSRVSDAETAADLVEVAIQHARAANRLSPTRPRSYAITQMQDALLWLRAYERGEIR